MKVIALTGGMGCGKSTAARIFRENNIPCVDADAVCHKLYQEDPELRRKLRERWGETVFGPDKHPDRKALADLVFNNPEELDALMKILLPLAKKKANAMLEEYRKNGYSLAILDAPLLYEAGWDKSADAVVCVWAPPALRAKRLKKDRGWSENEIQRRAGRQMSDPEKLERADYGIINSGDEDFLRRQCGEVLMRIRRKFKIKTT